MKLLILSNFTFFHNVFLKVFFLQCVKMSIYGEKGEDSWTMWQGPKLQCCLLFDLPPILHFFQIFFKFDWSMDESMDFCLTLFPTFFRYIVAASTFHAFLSFVLVISVYLPSLPVAHLNDAPRRRLVVTGDSARIQDETTENSAWFFNVLGV